MDDICKPIKVQVHLMACWGDRWEENVVSCVSGYLTVRKFKLCHLDQNTFSLNMICEGLDSHLGTEKPTSAQRFGPTGSSSPGGKCFGRTMEAINTRRYSMLPERRVACG
jgi:hypothetical protein